MHPPTTPLREKVSGGGGGGGERETEGGLPIALYTSGVGVGSMGAPGAGAPMKFLSGIQCHSYFTLKRLILLLLISVNIGTRAPVY